MESVSLRGLSGSCWRHWRTSWGFDGAVVVVVGVVGLLGPVVFVGALF